jgi:hypothetical protein
MPSSEPLEIELPDPITVDQIAVALLAAGDPHVWLSQDETWNEEQFKAIAVCVLAMRPILTMLLEADRATEGIKADLDVLFKAILEAAAIPEGFVSEAQLINRLHKIGNLVRENWEM